MPKYVQMRQEGGVMRQWQLWKCRKTMGQMIRETLRGQYKMSLLTIIIVILGIIYIISPIDLIPDRYFIIGWIDDLVVAFLVLKRLQFETNRFIRFKASQRRKGNL